MIVAISGASNVTGAFSDYLEATTIAHSAGARVVLDASQLVAHREVVPLGTPDEAIPDAIAFAGTKCMRRLARASF